MIASDWGRWLIDEIETASPDALTLWYLGCNGLALKAADGTIAYIDPYLGLGDPPRTVRMIPVPFAPDQPQDGDAIFVTHEHTDHLHGPTQGPMLANTGATLFASEHAIDLVRERGWLDTYDIDASQLHPVEPGETVSVGFFDIGIHPGTDPDATDPLTYAFHADGATLVHPGDGRPAPELETIGERLDVDLTVAAYGTEGHILDKETREPAPTTWYNTGNQALTIAEQLQAEVLVPTHWQMWKGLTADPTALEHHRRSRPYPDRLELLELGDRTEIPRARA